MANWMRHTATAAIALAVGLSVTPAAAQSLEEALASAYRSNPELLAQRAALRAVDEQVPRALSQWRPTVQVSGNAGMARDYNQTTTTVFGPAGSREEVTFQPHLTPEKKRKVGVFDQLMEFVCDRGEVTFHLKHLTPNRTIRSNQLPLFKGASGAQV